MRGLACIAIVASAIGSASAQIMSPASYQGLWWNSPAGSESGWGLNITHQGDVLFATWFTYDANGDGMWLVLPSASLMPTNDDDYGTGYGYGYGMTPTSYVYQGALYRTTGPAFDAATFDSSKVTVTPVGDASLRFTDRNSGQFSYTVNGVSQSRMITRQVYAAMPTCDLGATAGANANYQDLWWKSPAGSESGWGVNITHQGDILFATWFTYDASGKGLWLVVPSAGKVGANTYRGALYRTRGPAFNASPWSASQVSVTEVGTATFEFGGSNAGTFTYTVNGATQSKAITRQVYAAPTTVCR